METTRLYTSTDSTILNYPADAAFVSNYRHVSDVERGGMGAVFRAVQVSLDRPVAVKVLLPGGSPDRFLREARLLARIRSEYVVTVYDFMILPTGSPALVMEWVEGEDLGKLIRKNPQGLPQDQVFEWMRQTCEGMAKAAEQGIIHRDFKPSNILIDQHGQARVADFGLARSGDQVFDLSVTGQLMGTPYYMAPEQAEDPRTIDSRADIYSFGATFYHALAGRPPFDGTSAFSILYKHKTEQVLPLKSLRKDLSPQLSAIIERCLAKSPADRFSSFEELLKQLSPESSDRSPWLAQSDQALAPYLEQFERRKADYLITKFANEQVVDEYRFPRGQTLSIISGDLTKQPADALVSSDTFLLHMGAGVSLALEEAAGVDVHRELNAHRFARPGRVVITSAGNLNARFIFHGITAGLHGQQIVLASPDVIQEIMASCF